MLISLILLCSFFQISYASDEDFLITTDTSINYKTGDSHVTVINTYKRNVLNRSYYYPSSGEKIFHLPDLPDSTQVEIDAEREYKKETLSVKNSSGNDISYTVEDLDSGQGIYVKVPNYKQTTYSSPYEIVVQYNTHDYIWKVNDWVNIQAPALSSDTEFTHTDSENNTKTKYIYNLEIVTDSNISELAKIYPKKYTVDTKNSYTYYSFSQEDRLDNPIYLEFGTEQIYRFELRYETPKTDNFIPEKYSKIFKALSTNIFEISLPREFAETNQKVLFENVSPTPKSIVKDLEGNVIATFEVPANSESLISVIGYIWVKQNSLEKSTAFPNIGLTEYIDKIKDSEYALKYLNPTKYWEVNDTYIQQEAKKLSAYQSSLLDLITADYKYINDNLEYDISKATSENERIGAKNALQGGASVCMEYADAMIAILRAQGIPARAALGYSNLTEESVSNGNQVRHQWVQIWIPDYGWYSIDPTFESNNLKMGQEIDRVLWETFSGENLSNIRIYSADNLDFLNSDGYKVSIFGVSSENLPSEDKLKSYIELIPESNNVKELPESNSYNGMAWLNTFLKTTSIGKSIVITGPILSMLLVITIFIVLINIGLKKLKAKKRTTS